MTGKQIGLTLLLAAVLLLTVGCVKNYRITQGLQEDVPTGSSVVIGDIADALPIEMDEEDKPTLEHIDMLRRYLAEELVDREVFAGISGPDGDVPYEVTGSILEFKKGSGVARFFIGFGVGSARLTCALELRNTQTGEVVFSANFKQTVSSWAESGDEIFKRVAIDFAKALEKELKKLR